MLGSTKCSLCDELTGMSHSALWPSIAGGAAPPRIIGENDAYVALVTIGPVVRGHCLIIPRHHTGSMTASAPDECRLGVELLCKLAANLRRIYHTGALVFEHGTGDGSTCRPCSVGHAHWHVVPTDVNAREMLIPEFTWHRVTSPLIPPIRDYLLVGNEGAEYWATYPETLIPSQILRRRLAVLVGREKSWDWRKEPGVDCILRTIADLNSSHCGGMIAVPAPAGQSIY